jgi:glycine/D-amino acid oxidase-like deaminating enzyme
MLGVTAAAGTGRLIEEIISGKKSTIDLDAFNPARFG